MRRLWPTHLLDSFLRLMARAERGQVIVVAALLVPVVLGMAGIAIDVGFAMHERGHAANAADAAALAGAGVLLNGGGPELAHNVALSYAQKNGYGSSVTSVYIPPISGPHKGDGKYVEVRIASSWQTIFMRVLHVDSTAVRTRAVATYLAPPKNYALVILDPTMCSAFNMSSSANLTINNGGMMVNSSCNPSASQSGGSSISAKYLDYYYEGGWQLNNNATTSPPPTSVTQQLPDPLASLPRPVPCTSTTTYTPAGCTVLQSPDSGGTQANPNQVHITASNSSLTLHPGVYWGGINISGTGGTGDVNFLPGTYVFAGGGTNSGGFNYSGSASLSGNGVTFFNTDDPQASASSKQPCGPYSLTGNGVLDFTAPTSGIWKNMLFWQSDSCHETFKYAGGSWTTAGVIYLPTAQLSLTGGGNLGAMQVIVDSFTYSGSNPLSIDYTEYVKITPPKVTLVE
jgi:Flp pilus assembly protein TadG